ncbi:MAG: class I SAM-dependent methyltransferase [Spirochaetaceae bacterium]|jgi:SAM-dependent methyltransferase|nr:class I SAM-dependent methyltransferase [Spirochaetaceae bacterium]
MKNTMRDNIQFYTSLMSGKVKRKIIGVQNRFSYENVANNPSVKKYLIPFLKNQIQPSDNVLDYGCGNGILLPIISQFCIGGGGVIGFDIVPVFIDAARDLLLKNNIKNSSVYSAAEFNESFKENYFDVVIVNDVLHHMDNPKEAVENIYKLLKPDGKLIILEPNRLNPAILILHAADPNEQKWLKMGYFKYYENITRPLFKIIKKDWSPLVYGPSSRLVLLMAEISENFPFKLLRWILPRLYLIFKVIK